MSRYFVYSYSGTNIHKAFEGLNEKIDGAIENGYFPCSAITIVSDNEFVTIMQPCLRGDVIKELYKQESQPIYKYTVIGNKPTGKNKGESFCNHYKNIMDAEISMDNYERNGYTELTLTKYRG